MTPDENITKAPEGSESPQKPRKKTGKKVQDVSSLEASIRRLEGELAEVKKVLEDTKKTLEERTKENLYLRADFENYRKAMEKKVADFKDIALENVLRPILDISENIERLKDHAAKETDIKKLQEGITSVYNHICSLLSSCGVEEMKVLGERFDPMKHEAVIEETSSTCEDGTVTRVLQKGYLLKGRVMRPAKVCVARRVESGPPAEEKKGEGKVDQGHQVQAQNIKNTGKEDGG